jgi:hypothetical protein
MKKIGFILTLLIGLIFSSCQKGHEIDCFKSNGKETQQTRTLNPFQFINIKDKVDVIINEGNEFKVVVSGGEHLINNIKTEIKENTLYISNTNKCNMVRGYKRRYSVTVTLPQLKYLENKGSNTVSFYNGSALDTLEIKAASPGSVRIYGDFEQINSVSQSNGDVYLNGSTNHLTIYMTGNPFFYGENMIVKKHAFVESYSIGHCYLNLTNTPNFEYRLWEKGNVYYNGTPQTIINYTNAGVKGQAIAR